MRGSGIDQLLEESEEPKSDGPMGRRWLVGWLVGWLVELTWCVENSFPVVEDFLGICSCIEITSAAAPM